MAFAAGTRVAQYQVEQLLGSGGMGEVYLARHVDLDRLVALKIMRDDKVAEESCQRFLREARTIARLDHSNIVRVYDVGYHAAQPFLAMEFVQGETVAVRLSRGRGELWQSLEWFEQLCEGLAHAHDASVVHRDIKPANLVIAANGVLKILDFGIAHLGTHTLTETGAFIGTLHYAAPEQLTGAATDHRVDIFSAGAVMFEVLTGRRPFTGTSDAAVLHAVLHTTPRIPPHEAPEGIRDIVHRALRKEAGLRYQSARELKAALSMAHTKLKTETETVSASRVEVSSPPPSGRSESTRYRMVAWLGGAGVAVAVAAVVWALYTSGSDSRRLADVPDPLPPSPVVEAPQAPQPTTLPAEVRAEAGDPNSSRRSAMALATRLVNTNQDKAALAALNGLSPDAAEVKALLGVLRGRAEARVTKSREAAVSAGSRELAPDDMARAESVVGESRSARYESEALKYLWSAADLYDTAARRATQAREAQSVPVSQPLVPEVRRPAVNTPAAETSPETVLEALREYARAMQSRDPAAVKRIQPGINEIDLARAFASMREIEMQLEDVELVSYNEKMATVRCKVTQIVTASSGLKQGSVLVRVIRFRRTADKWILDAFER